MLNNTVANMPVQQASAVSLYNPDTSTDFAPAGGGQSFNRDASNQEKDSNKREILRLRSLHPTYVQYKSLWDFYLASYEGGQSFANETNLFKHPREHPDDFKERSKRIYYHNFVFPIVDFFTTFIFSETIHRDGGEDSDWYNGFIADVNKKGADVTSFMSDVCDDMQVFGLCYVLVDSPQKTDLTAVTTVADEQAQGIQPYWVLMRADEVLDWVVDDFENFMYLKRVQNSTEVDPQTMQVTRLEVYTEWTPTNIKVSKVDVTKPGKPLLVNTTDLINEVGCVPVEVVRFKRSKVDSYVGESFLRDISYISREVMNLTSLLQEFLYRQCFNMLAMEEDDNVPELDQMQGDIGTANILKYPKGATVPTYITPPVAPAQFLQQERGNNIDAMFKIAAQDTESELFNGGKASGFSKSQSFQRTVPKIATRADALEDLETRLMRLTAKFAGKDTWQGSIKYKDHYEVTNLADSLSQMSSLFKDLQIQSNTFANTQLKRMVSLFDGKLSQEDLAKVNKEIDDMDMDEWFDTQKLAFIGRAAAAPDAALAFDDQTPATGAGLPPVPGKDSPTSPTTAQSPTPTASTVQAASTKTP